MTKRRNISSLRLVLEALRCDKTLQEVVAMRQLHPAQVGTWKRRAIENIAGEISDKVRKAGNKDGEIRNLRARIGQLAVEKGF